jgi:hypothetical protein
MRIEVYIREKVVSVSCGIGAQKIRWLVEAASIRYDPNAMLATGEPKLVKLEDGTLLNMGDRISDKLVDNARVWVLYEELALSPEKKKDGKKK